MERISDQENQEAWGYLLRCIVIDILFHHNLEHSEMKIIKRVNSGKELERIFQILIAEKKSALKIILNDTDIAYKL